MKAPFRPLPYEAWREQQLAQRQDDDQVECPECNGEGECPCDSCGHETECDTCGGAGKLPWGDLRPDQQRRLLTHQAHVEAVLRDATAWAGWLGRDPAHELFHAGFIPWCSTATRELRVHPTSGGVQ